MGRLITRAFEKDLYLLISTVYIGFLEDRVSPVKSGNLKRSWVLQRTNELEYIITNDAEYAKFLDEGTGIYRTKGSNENYAKVAGAKPIVPKEKKAMKFSIGGVTIFAKSIKGIKPIKMIQAVASSTQVKKDFDAGLQKLFEKHYFSR